MPIVGSIEGMKKAAAKVKWECIRRKLHSVSTPVILRPNQAFFTMLLQVTLFVFLGGLLLQVPAYGQAEPMVIADPQVKLYSNGVTYYEDDQNQLDQVAIMDLLDGFQPVEGELYSKPPKNSTTWISFSVKNRTDETLWMDIEQANITHFEWYKLNQKGDIVDAFVTGVFEPKSSRRYESHTFWTPLVTQGDTNTYRYLMAIRTHVVRQFPLLIGSKSALMAEEKERDIATYMYLGCILIMLLYNLNVYFSIKDRLYLIYSGTLFTLLFAPTYLANYPILEYLLPADFVHNYTFAWMWGIQVATGAFLIEYFKLYQTAPKLFRLLLVVMGLIVLIGLLNLVLPIHYIVNPGQFLALLFYLICLIISFVFVRWKYRGALLLFLAWVGMVFSIFTMVLTGNGFLHYNFWTSNAGYLGTVFEILVLSLALGDRINTLRLQQVKLNKELVNKNNDLASMNESLDSFTYHVSHDLKTVLSNGLALSNMVKKYNTQKDFNKIDEIVQKQILVMQGGQKTIKGFLSLGSVISDFGLNKEKTTLSIEKSIETVLINNGLEKSIAIRYGYRSTDEILFSHAAFESVFFNLFTNTIKYNKNAPQCEIEVHTVLDDLRIVYRDNGIGIDMERDGDKLFAPFVRLNNGLNLEGSGIGLYLVKRIIEGFGGQIKATSTPGKGICFTLVLPNKKTF